MTENAPRPPERFLANSLRRVRNCAIAVLVVLAVTVLAAHFFLLQMDEQIRAHMERVLTETNPHLVVRVQRARRLNASVIEVRFLSLAHGPGQEPFLLIDEAQIACNTDIRHLLKNQSLEITAIRLNRPHVRARIASDGTCDLTKLAEMTRTTGNVAPVQIHDGMIDLLVEGDGPARRIQLRDVDLRVDHDVSTAEGAADVRIHGSYSGDHLKHATFDFRRNGVKGDWSVRGKVDQLSFSESLLAKLPQVAADRLAPLSDLHAVASFDYAISEMMDGRPLLYELKGNLRDGHLTDPGFPYVFTDLSAEYTCNNSGLDFRNVRAKSGQAEISLAFQGSGITPGRPFGLTATALRLPLDSRLANALPPQMRQVWDEYQPTGEIDATLSLKYDGSEWTPTLDIDVRRLNYVYAGFPYRVNGAFGTMKLVGQKLTTDLHLTVDGQRVEVDSELNLQTGHSPVGWIAIETMGPIALDEELIGAMRPQHQQIARSLNVSGLIQCKARFERSQGDPEGVFRKSIQLDVTRGTLQYDKFPYPVSGIRGRVDFHDDGWVTKRLEGYNDAAFVTLSGSYVREAGDAERGDLRLVINGFDVPLNNELRLAMPESAREVWSTLSPRGALDKLTIRVDRPAWADQASYHVVAEKADNEDPRGAISLTPSWFPYRWDQVSGRCELQNGQLVIRSLSGQHGTARLILDGAGHFGSSGWGVTLSRLSLENARINGELASAIRPTRLRQAVIRSRVAGPVRVEGSMEIAGQPNRPVTSKWNIYVDLENGSLDLGVPVRAIRGGVRLRGGYDGQHFNSSGALAVDSMLLNNVHLTRVHGPIWIDDNRILMGADAFSLRPELQRQSVLGLAYQGVVSLDGVVGLTGDNAFQVKVGMSDGNLAHIVRNWSSTPGELTGKIDAHLLLHGNGRGTHTWKGNGDFHLSDADIYRLPVMVGLLKLLSIRQPDDTAFTNGTATFNLQGEHIYFRQIDLSGDIFTLRGTGEMDLQRNVNLQFYAAIGRDRFYIPVIRPLLGDASRSFLLIEVDGSLDRPHIERKAFPQISERLRQLLPPDASPDAAQPVLPSISIRDYIPPALIP
jgi:hypothetical protein